MLMIRRRGAQSRGNPVAAILQEVAMKMTTINAEAAADQSMADRLAASFMREIALLKVRAALT